MSESIQQIIAECAWDTTNFLIISGNVFDPFIYYSHLLPLVASVLIGYFIFFKNPRLLVNQILFVLTNLFALWVFFDLILWATDKPDYTIFFWSLVNLIEPFIYVFGVYFVQVFISGKDTSIKSKILLFIPILPVIVLAFTQLNLLGFNLSNCDREAIEGPLAHYIYILEVFYLVVIALNSLHALVGANLKNKAKSIQIILVTVSILCFFLAFSWGNIVGSLTDSWRVSQWGLFGMPIFIIALAYLIIKYNSFNIKVISTQILVTAFPIIVGSQYFLTESFGSRLITVITFFSSIFVGIFIVESVKKEIEARERIEKLAGDLKKANTRLLELDKQKSEFVSFATHQLRAPLTAMKGYASLIMEGEMGEISAQTKDAVGRIYDSSKTLTNVVDDYLNISRIELGTMKYNFEVLDLREMVGHVMGELKPNIEKSGLEFTFSTDPSGPAERFMVHADKDKFKQVIMNLIDNSIKYTPKGSIKVSINKNIADRKIVFSIKDTGVGIAPEVMPKLFAKFIRAENANKQNIYGTGLGLFVAKEIVTAHKGRLWAESEGEGKGSKFCLEMDMEV